MSNCNFQVGQKVVCIVDSHMKINDLGLPGFKKGQILTVSSIFVDDADGHLKGPEAFLTFYETGDLHAGHHSGFRPIIERKTDISIFTDMLIEQKQPVDA